MTQAAAPTVRRIIRMLSFAVALVAAVLLFAPRAALAEAVTSGPALADALNARAAGSASASADGGVVTLLAPVRLTGDDPLEIAVPAGESLTLELASNDLALENGGDDAAAQLLVSGGGILTIDSAAEDPRGTVVSKTADGLIPAISVTAGTLELTAPVAVETPALATSAVLADGGTLVLGENSEVTGVADGMYGPAAVVGVQAGTLSLEGGTVTCKMGTSDVQPAAVLAGGGVAKLVSGTVDASDVTYAVIALDDGVAFINDGVTVTGSVQALRHGTLTITGGFIHGDVSSDADSDLTVTVSDETGIGPIVTYPVGLEYLEGVGAVNFDFSLSGDQVIVGYYDTMATAEADKLPGSGAGTAPVGEFGYICGLTFMQSGQDATNWYRGIFHALGVDDITESFDGPTMMALVVTKPGVDFDLVCEGPSGSIIHRETIPGPVDADFTGLYFDMCLPDDPAQGVPAIGPGEYTVELATTEAPDDMFTSSTLAISQVNRDLDGGSLPVGHSPAIFLPTGRWGLGLSPTRPGYELTGWTSPTPGLVSFDEESGIWYLTIGDVPGTYTITAQWEIEVLKVYRLWQPQTGAHLLTTDANEVRVLTTERGWHDEGEVFTAYAGPVAGSVPVTRMLNPHNGDHLFTTSAAEVRGLEAVGWRSEGVRFYGTTDTAHPVYRLWNSAMTADGGLGSHLWTPDFNEYATLPMLPPVGAWQDEGVGWYAVGLPS